MAAHRDWRIQLLDTLPEPFTYETRILYSHFARYDLSLISAAEGKHRTAMLRQLADLFDNTGKTVFYCYAVPRLCKQSHPPTAGETVTGQAAEAWSFLDARVKGEWERSGVRVKKLLGDGDLEGLDVLRLESLGMEVLRSREMARTALEGVVSE